MGAAAAVALAGLVVSCSRVQLTDVDGQALQTGSVVRGGELYDKWWVAAGVDAPEDTQPLWSTQETNPRQGASTWRCKECHGWDYRGAQGAYDEGSSHYTGFDGVLEARQVEPEALREALTSGQHDFSAMGDGALDDMVAFLRAGTLDVSPYIDAETRATVDPDLGNGRQRYRSVCMNCHGADGAKINFGDEGDPEFLGQLARSNPWEVFHKIRFGQPGTRMPSAIALGWSIEDVRDVTAYAQTRK